MPGERNKTKQSIKRPVGYGLSPKYMFKEGWKITLLVLAVMSVACALLLKYWPAFSSV